MNSMAWLRAAVGAEQENLLATGAGGYDHAFANTELHLSRGEICHADHQPADEVFRFVGAFDAGENGAMIVAAEA